MPTIVTPEELAGIEKEHSLLAAQVTIVCEAFDNEHLDRDEIIRAIRDLQKLATSHFAHEESLMDEDNYAEMFAHKKDHQYLLNSIREYISMFYGGTIVITRGGGDAFSSWINYHERKYDNFMKRSIAELPASPGERIGPANLP